MFPPSSQFTHDDPLEVSVFSKNVTNLYDSLISETDLHSADIHTDIQSDVTAVVPASQVDTTEPVPMVNKLPDRPQRQRTIPVKLHDYAGLPSHLVNGVTVDTSTQFSNAGTSSSSAPA